MTPIILGPQGPDFGCDGRLGPLVLAYALTGDGRECVVQQRMYNVILTIGPVGMHWFSDSW